MGISDLHISFLDEEVSVPPGQSFTFGRSGDLSIDHNKYLHRVAGRFLVVDGAWSLENTGDFMTLTLRGQGKAIPTTIPPGQQVRLIDSAWTVTFKAGRFSYEIEGWFEADQGDDSRIGFKGAGDSTEIFGIIELSEGQREVVVALAENVLRGALDPAYPSSKDISQRLGGPTEKAVERRLDVVASKLHAAGVGGVRGVPGASADQRRRRIARHLIECRIITVHDLQLLP